VSGRDFDGRLNSVFPTGKSMVGRAVRFREPVFGMNFWQIERFSGFMGVDFAAQGKTAP
jgi:hypothetical protein